MNNNNVESRLDSIRLTYNEKNRRIVASLITSVDDVKVRSRTIDNIGTIKQLMESLAKQCKLPISNLIELGIITIDNRMLEQGVIVLEGKEYKKYIFDTENGIFISTKLNRMDQKELGIREDFGKVNSDDMTVERVADIEPDEEVVETKEATPINEEKVDIIDKDTTNHDTHLLYEITEIIQRLNPTADIRVGRLKDDGDASYRFFSSVPARSLVLPDGVKHSEIDDWIECEIDSKPVRFLIENLSLADESKLIPSVKEYLFGDKVLEDKKDEETLSTTDDTERVSSEMHDEVSEDGSLEAIEGPTLTKEIETKGVRNLKINKRVLIALGLVPVILVGSMLLERCSKDDAYSKDNSTPVPENNAPIEQQYEYETHDSSLLGSPIYVGDYENIEDRIQIVNDLCVPYRECNLYDLVDESDKETIKVINDARNLAISNSNKTASIIDEYAKYIFEGRTMFNNGVVKGYDYLTPFSRYVVLASGQTLLQLCHDYNYSTVHNNYTFDLLNTAFDELINDTCNDLNINGKVY